MAVATEKRTYTVDEFFCVQGIGAFCVVKAGKGNVGCH
jgi:hypothetical protein